MPTSNSAKKRVRQNEKRNQRNRAHKEQLKKAVKSFTATLASGDQAAITEGLKKITKAVDRAGDKGIIHANAVNRRKSRFAHLAQSAGQ